jgi:hypothetical protein
MFETMQHIDDDDDDDDDDVDVEYSLVICGNLLWTNNPPLGSQLEMVI